MARFRRATADGDPTSWRRWSRAVEEDKFEGDLREVESDLDTFGDSGGRGFSEAWDAQGDSEATLPEAAAEDKRSARMRNLDRRRGPVFYLLLLAVLGGLGAAAYFGYQEYVADADVDEVAEDVEPFDLIVPPGLPRTYSEGDARLNLAPDARLREFFTAEAFGTDPQPVPDAPDGIPATAEAALLWWGGRLHVAVAGPDVGAADLCAVTTLLSAEVEVLDLASGGACGDRYEATGDRVACRSDSLVVLEVWPRNPSVDIPQPDPTTLRVRIERQLPSGEVHSVRSTSSIDGAIDAGLDELAGSPGAEATLAIGAVRGTCTMVDRSDVAVRLL